MCWFTQVCAWAAGRIPQLARASIVCRIDAVDQVAVDTDAPERVVGPELLELAVAGQ